VNIVVIRERFNGDSFSVFILAGAGRCTELSKRLQGKAGFTKEKYMHTNDLRLSVTHFLSSELFPSKK
jgi:hypothetical protein